MQGRKLTPFLFAAALVLGWATTAGAGTYPPGSESLEAAIDPTSGPAGTVITVTGGCLEGPDDDCDAALVTLLDPSGAEVDSFLVEEDVEAFEGELTVPDDATCGEFTVLVEGIESEAVLIDQELPFSVTTGCPEPTTTTTAASTTTAAVAAAAAPRFTG